MQHQSKDIHPLLQEYARWSRIERIRGMLLSGLIVVAFIAGYFVLPESYIRDEHRVWLLVLSFIPLALFVYMLIWRRNHLHIFYRLSWVLENVKPIKAELMLKQRGVTNNRAYFIDFYQIIGEQPWGVADQVRLVWPRGQNEESIADQRQWAKIYFDPEYEGNAVYLIKDNIFVSTRERRLWG